MDQDCSEEIQMGEKREPIKTDTLIYATIFHYRLSHLNCIIFKEVIYVTVSDSIRLLMFFRHFFIKIGIKFQHLLKTMNKYKAAKSLTLLQNMSNKLV